MQSTRSNHISDWERTVVGIMTGTSMDGIDVAVVQISGHGPSMSIQVLNTESFPMDSELRDALNKNANDDTSSAREIALLNVRLAHVYADAVRSALGEAGISLGEVDAIGSHGQTLYHEPNASNIAGVHVSGTLQIGDPSVLANLLQKTVVGDFRLADMALGGQGAPLIPYFDFVCFCSEHEGRLLLNLGGIANITVLPAACSLKKVTAFDTGPANTIIDGLVNRLFDRSFDEDGDLAGQGVVNDVLLAELLDEPYFEAPPPKSTGRELFSSAYISAIIARAQVLGVNNLDLLATATALTYTSIAKAYKLFVAPNLSVQRLIVSGGGVHNTVLMRGLQSEFGDINVESTEEHGVDPDAKEAICFAVLAHETLSSIPTNVPSATGASRATILGKICLSE